MSRRLPSIMIMFFVLILSGQSAFSRARAREAGEGAGHSGMVVEEFAIYYRVNKTDIDTTYLDNPSQIRHILRYISTSPKIDSIVIYAWASPEGSYRFNKYLSIERAKAAKRFLLEHSPDSSRFNSEKIRISPLAENWPGLLRLVEEKYHRHDRDKVISILNENGIGDETRKWRLKQLDGGYTWSFLIRRYMPELRAATWISIWEKIIEPVAAPVVYTEFSAPQGELARTYAVPGAVAKTSHLSVLSEKMTVAAARTNLLVPGLNAGVSVPVGNNWSVGVDYYYPWIPRKWDRKNCFQLLGLCLEGRYWFGKGRTDKDRLQGHSIGINLSGGYYDVENAFTGHQGEFISLGLDYLYSLPVCRDMIHLEFTLGLGYLYSYARPYDVFEAGGKAFKEGYVKNIHWFGPCKAGVSLVVPIKIKRRDGR